MGSSLQARYEDLLVLLWHISRTLDCWSLASMVETCVKLPESPTLLSSEFVLLLQRWSWTCKYHSACITQYSACSPRDWVVCSSSGALSPWPLDHPTDEGCLVIAGGGGGRSSLSWPFSRGWGADSKLPAVRPTLRIRS